MEEDKKIYIWLGIGLTILMALIVWYMDSHQIVQKMFGFA